MKIRILLWKLGLLGNKCPICNTDMMQKGHGKIFTYFECTNKNCKFGK